VLTRYYFEIREKANLPINVDMNNALIGGSAHAQTQELGPAVPQP
jgi:hypothetical protein